MNGFSVHVETRYLEEESGDDRYVFSYTITIENRGTNTAQLLNRHWVITDAEGEVQEVRGEGVVGQQPSIPPERGFRYTSGCILKTPVGTMEGEYEFVGEDGLGFDVPIPAFRLSVPNLVH